MTTRLKEIFREIAERYEFEIDTMEAMDDHVHLFLVVPPKYAPASVVSHKRLVLSAFFFRDRGAVQPG